MCDQLDGRGCEIVDELYLVITNLEMTIADLKSEIVEDLCSLNKWPVSLPYSFEPLNILKKKWEVK